jgi:DNA-binding CsgD family transcriptional regulator
MSEWRGLFDSAFKQSRNAMALVNERRSLVEVNGAFLRLTGYKRLAIIDKPVYTLIAGGPVLSRREWAAALAREEFTGEVGLICADDSVVMGQWGAHTAGVVGDRIVLFVMLSRSRWGGRFRRTLPPDEELGALSERELEVVRLVALGQSSPEIADELGIAHDTVRTHVRNAMAKVGARSRAHLVAKTLGEGHALR